MKILPDVVRRAQAGDRAALARLVGETQDALFHFLARELGSTSAAEDALQETWVQAMRWLPSLREPAAFAGWIHRIALRVARDLAVGERARKLRESAASRHERVEGEAMGSLEERERAARVQAAVNDLEPELRATVRLRYEQGLSYAEIAEATESPSGTVGKRLHTAHERLRERLAGVGVVLALAVLEKELEAAERIPAPASARRRLQGLVPGTGVAAGRRRLRRAIAAATAVAVLLLAVAWIRKVNAAGRAPDASGAADLAANRPGPEPTAGAAGAESAPGRAARKADPPPPLAEGHGRVTGRVTDAQDRTPVAGATVRIRPVGKAGGKRAAASAVTDSDGRYVVDAAPGEYYVDAWGDNHPPFSAKQYIEEIVVGGRRAPHPEEEPIQQSPFYVALAAGGETHRDIELARGRRLRGTILDDRGFPVAGATVSTFFQRVPAPPDSSAMLETTVPGRDSRVTTGADGRFELPAVWPSGTVWLRVSCAGFRKSETAVELIGLGSEVTIPLQPGQPVGGTVIDRGGVPVAGARVFVSEEGAFLRELKSRTDACGLFADRSGSARDLVLAWAPGSGPAAAVIGGPDAERLTLTLQPCDAQVRGVVRDDRGRFLPGASVRAKRFGATRDGRTAWIALFPDIACSPDERLAVVEQGLVLPETTTAADGSFTLAGLPLGAGSLVSIEFSAPGFKSRVVVQKDSSDMLVYLSESGK